ncbi:MAG TPA: TIGR01212 family radical SAM protein [Bacteroidales bacterium]|nr:TIGR01212 family radical SAM protein [Bacteroidales bacterium]
MENRNKRARFLWDHDRRFNAYSNYFTRIFGGRVQKVSIDAGFTCPNRDGSAGVGGCTFCNNDAFNPSYCTPDKTITTQILEGISFHKKRYRRAIGYLAYFQAFSNTYASIQRLKECYREALEIPGIIGIVIGTRPDCIDNEKLDYFEELSGQVYTAIEYGVESCYDKTLLRINRGHNFEASRKAIIETAKRKINTGAHFVFGLPGETREEMMAESSIISGLPLTTVKLHQLQIIKGTAMEREYLNNPGEFELFERDEYVDFIIRFLERLNPSIIVERFTGEAPPDLISGPRWGLKRTDQIMDIFKRRMEELDSWQGKHYKSR